MLVAEFLMREKGITQAEVAERGGISRPAVNMVLRGHIKAFPKYKKAFCEALEWDGNPEELFKRVDVRPAEAESVEAWNNRTERTCRVKVGASAGWWECQSCGALFDMADALAAFAALGYRNKKLPNYCPNCGAKVVGE